MKTGKKETRTYKIYAQKICVENFVFSHSVSEGKSMSYFRGQLRYLTTIVNMHFHCNIILLNYSFAT